MADAPNTDPPQEYLLEWVRGTSQQAYRAMLIPNVSRWEPEPIPSDDTAYPIRLGAHPIKQSAGIVEQHWVFEGRSGEEEREVTFVDTSQNATRLIAGGVEIFEEFLRFLRDYEDDKRRYQSTYSRDPNKAPKMIVRALKQGLAYYCDDIRITPRTAVGSSRCSYEYTLTLTTEGEAKVEAYADLVNDPVRSLQVSEEKAAEAFVPKSSNDVGQRAVSGLPLVGTNTDKAKALNAVVTAPRHSTLDELATFVAELPAEAGMFRSIAEGFAEQVAQATEFVSRPIESGLGFPRDVASNMAIYANRAIQAAYRAWDALDVSLRDRLREVKDRFRSIARRIGRGSVRVLGAAGAKLGSEPQLGQTAVASGTVQAQQGQAARMVRLGLGDDLLSLAERFLGSADLWREIASLNGMVSAWQLADGRPLQAGTPLLVPVDDAAAVRPEADPSELYGVDLRWDFRRQDILVEGTSPTDFAAVRGKHNLRQAMLRRATVVQGRCRVFPRLGMPDLVGRNSSAELAALHASRIVSQFAGDRRIRRVRNVRIQSVANIFSVKLTVDGVGGEALPLSGLGAPVENSDSV